MVDTKNLLDQWDADLSTAQHNNLDAQLARRRFLHTASKASAAALMLPTMTLFSACQQTQTGPDKQLKQEPWLSFARVQLILFPNDGDGPSASDLNATAYLNFVLTADDTDPEERDFIYQGISWLDQLAHTNHQTRFIKTSPAQQAQLITDISKSKSGERWLSYLLLYLFEALLSDPAYGGNPNGIGWNWLDHQPGFPRPDKTKIYPQLLKR